MGDHDVRTGEDEAARRAFTRALLDDLRALDRMIAGGVFEDAPVRIGAEQEMFIVDAAGRPACRAVPLLATLGPPFTSEIAQFNLEANLAPVPLNTEALGRMEDELTALLSRARVSAQALGCDILLAGTLPSIELADLDLTSLTPEARYHELNRVLCQAIGGSYRTHIAGDDDLDVDHDNILLEACNTSFQIHLQVPPGDFAATYNTVQAITAPVLAAAVNAPLLLQRRLWRETRIALFEQSMDIRSVPHRLRGTWRRVSFGNRWVDQSVRELFEDAIARHRVLILAEPGESSSAMLARGDLPHLRALALHNSTVYRWNRPCVGAIDGKAHLRIEHRPLPAGPTPTDELANAAFFYGLVAGLGARIPDVRERFAFDDVRANFLAAARYGLHATFRWQDGRAVGARELILGELLDVAAEGLARIGIDPHEAASRLGIIRERVDTGLTGACWTLQAFERLRGIRSATVRSQAVTRAILARQWNGTPVHRWPLPDPTEVPSPEENYRTVAQVMTTDLFTLHPDDLVDIAASLMDWKHIRHIPVEDDQGRLVGLVSYRALLRLLARGRGPEGVPVRDLMHTAPVTIGPEASCREAIMLMRDRQVACLPVVHRDRLIGIVSERDFLALALTLVSEPGPATR